MWTVIVQRSRFVVIGTDVCAVDRYINFFPSCYDSCPGLFNITLADLLSLSDTSSHPQAHACLWNFPEQPFSIQLTDVAILYLIVLSSHLMFTTHLPLTQLFPFSLSHHRVSYQPGPPAPCQIVRFLCIFLPAVDLIFPSCLLLAICFLLSVSLVIIISSNKLFSCTCPVVCLCLGPSCLCLEHSVVASVL